MAKKKLAKPKAKRSVKPPEGGLVYGRDNAKRMLRTMAKQLDGNESFTVVIALTKRGGEITGHFSLQR
jgi:hypothetical protein